MPRAEDLIYRISAEVDEFESGARKVDQGFDRMERGADDMEASVRRSTSRAARQMERDFAQATVGIGAKLRNLRGIGVDAKSLFGAATGAIGAMGVGTGLFGAVGGFAGGAAIQLVNDTAAAVADLRAQAQRAGVDFEAFQRIVAGFSGERVGIDATTDALKEMQLRADEFIKIGTGGGAEYFKNLGYDAETLSEKLQRPDALLFEILDKISQLGSRGAQIRALDEIFGGEGGEQLMQVIANLERVKRTMRETSVLTSEQADKAAEVTRAFQELQNVIQTGVQGALVDIGHAMSPIITGATDVLRVVRDWKGAAEDFLRSQGTIGNWMADTYLTPGGFGPGMARAVGAALKPPQYDSVMAQVQLQGQLDVVDDLTDRLDRVNKLVELNGAALGKEALWTATQEAERLRVELTAATAKLQEMWKAWAGLANVPFVGQPLAAPAVGNSLPTSHANVETTGLKAEVKAGVDAAIKQFPGLQVSSGYRSPAHNQAVGGARGSQHLQGNAVDLVGFSPEQGPALIEYLQSKGFRGFGHYGGRSMHADMRDKAAYWGPDYTSGSLGRTPAWFQQAAKGGTQYGPQLPVAEGMKLSAEQWAEEDRARQDRAREAAQEAKRLAEEQAQAKAKQTEVLASFNQTTQEEIDLEKMRQDMMKSGKFTQDEINIALQNEAKIQAEIRAEKEAGLPVDAAREEAIRRQIGLLQQQEIATHELGKANEALKDAAVGVLQPMSEELLNVIDGTTKAEDAAKSLMKTFARMLLQAALFGQGPLGGLLGGSSGGGLVGSLFAGARAAGGPVSAGKTYLVGEEGPELWTAGANGHIIDAARTQAAIARAAAPMPMPARGAGGIKQTVNQYFDLNGATGDEGIRRIAEDAARRGRGEAIAYVQTNFGTIAKGYQSERG